MLDTIPTDDPTGKKENHNPGNSRKEEGRHNEAMTALRPPVSLVRFLRKEQKRRKKSRKWCFVTFEQFYAGFPFQELRGVPGTPPLPVEGPLSGECAERRCPEEVPGKA